MDEAFWESFEPIFTEYNDKGVEYGIALDKIKSKIEAEGYRCIENFTGTDFEELPGQILWDKIQEAFAEGGSVFYCRTNLVDGEFVWVKEIENPVELNLEVQITKYFDGEYDDTEDQHRSHYDDVLKEIGLEIREEMKDVDGEQTYVKEIMFNRYHGNFQKMWFTDSIIIPQPFNMSWPQWLITAIRNALTKQKL